MENRPKPNLAELSELVSGLTKVRITLAIKIQRILVLACSDITRETAARSLQNLQVTSDEAVFASVTVGQLTAPDIRENLISRIQSNSVDIVLIETGALATETQAALEEHFSNDVEKRDFVAVRAFPLNAHEATELRHLIYQRRRSFAR